ncbi:radical SAM protein [Brooklawnia propionicigenes]|uniref:radical SAM protein n=1 Tax=Brooklawnia propionicigenes TaxID=3041175 RepID=UPI0025722BF2|nr:radical SAM protein [Brooklawnia sp. SH051]
MSLEELRFYADRHSIPVEDVVFIALNFFGLNWDVEFNRMRTALRLSEDSRFSEARALDEWNYYLALPVRPDSPFRLENGDLLLGSDLVGRTFGATEDYCDSHYQRRMGTCLNINPNTRTSCRGCDFCYTAYQVPLDRQKMTTPDEIRGFFTNWVSEQRVPDLSHLQQISIVTGCYGSEAHLVNFLLSLRDEASKLGFDGRIFYLGSALSDPVAIKRLGESGPFGYCISLECFDRRTILHRTKAALSLEAIKETMSTSMDAGMEVNYTYIVGLEPIEEFIPRMEEFTACTNKFPTVNLLQLHQQHDAGLRDPSAGTLDYYLSARRAIENIYRDTELRPKAWEDYRSLWFLRFGGEAVEGPRFPDRESISELQGLSVGA